MAAAKATRKANNRKQTIAVSTSPIEARENELVKMSQREIDLMVGNVLLNAPVLTGRARDDFQCRANTLIDDNNSAKKYGSATFLPWMLRDAQEKLILAYEFDDNWEARVYGVLLYAAINEGIKFQVAPVDMMELYVKSIAA
jgi:hypothetical protein